LPSKRKKLRKKGVKTLDFFLNRKAGQETKDYLTKDKSKSTRKDELEVLFNELFKPMQTSLDKSRTDLVTMSLTSKSKQGFLEKETLVPHKEEVPKEVVLLRTPIPEGDILRKLLEKPIRTINEIMCSSDGLCKDDRRLSEIFIDEFGFKRQRGFVRTTRAPVFLDWIVEEAVVSKILPTAYKVETSRGAIALIPENFLCELDKRYGVLLKNYDCSNYKLSISPSEKRRK